MAAAPPTHLMQFTETQRSWAGSDYWTYQLSADLVPILHASGNARFGTYRRCFGEDSRPVEMRVVEGGATIHARLREAVGKARADWTSARDSPERRFIQRLAQLFKRRAPCLQLELLGLRKDYCNFEVFEAVWRDGGRFDVVIDGGHVAVSASAFCVPRLRLLGRIPTHPDRFYGWVVDNIRPLASILQQAAPRIVG